MRLSKARKEIVTAVMKDTICEAAGTVLAEHGTAGLTMDRVATTAGMASGSLYNYFRNKDDLVLFVHARLVEPFLEAMEETLRADLTVPQKIETALSTALKNGNEHRGLLRLLADSCHQSQIRKTIRPRLLKIFSDAFQRGIAEGSFRPHNASHAARLFVGALSELVELQASAVSEAEMNGYIAFLKDTFVAGLSVTTTVP